MSDPGPPGGGPADDASAVTAKAQASAMMGDPMVRPPEEYAPWPTSERGSRARGQAQIAFWIAGVLGLVVGLWPLYLAVAVAPSFVPVAVVAHVTGMLAGYGALVMLILMSRWPVLEHGIGADRVSRWHAVGGRTVLTLVLVHAVTAVVSWAEATGVGVGTALVQVLAFPWTIAAVVGTVLMIMLAVVSVRRARRSMSYERWHLVHLLGYLAIALGFVHQLGGPDLAGYPVLQVLWSLMYVHTFALILRHRVISPLRSAVRHRMRVVQVVEEIPGVTSIVIEGEHLEELQAQPGQFFRWRFLTPATWVTAHPFSLSAAPRRHRLRLTVKQLGDGSALLQDLKVGTRVMAEGPYGAITAHRRTRRDVLLIAGGVGITPMRALFESMPLAADQSMTLLYRADLPEHVVFRYELDLLAERRKARVVYLFGRDQDLVSARSLSRLVPGLVEHDVFLCGPPGLSSAIRANLAEAGHPPRLLHEERFAF